MFNFIKATEEFNDFDKNVPAPYIRKSFVCDAESRGKIKIAVCGFYELFFNGNKITKGFFSPYISNTNHYVYYDEYEVMLNEGENVIGIILGNGFQNNPGGYVWDFDKCSFRSAPMVALNLEYSNRNGELTVISTDKTFKTHPSPILFDDYRYGEVYDANLEILGWNQIGFDDSSWKEVILTESPKGEIKLCEAEPIVKETEIKPVDIFKEGDSYIYDFGVSNAGMCRLCVNGRKGQKIEWQHTDLLKDGKFFFDNLWFTDWPQWERDKEIVHKDVYICKGEDNETYTPSFAYHGFRYVKVKGITEEQAKKDLLTYVVVHSDLETRGGFSCSDEIANTLQTITRRSDISNFQYFPLDCPQREKNGWTGDVSLSSEQMTLNFATELSYREWMNNIRKAQKEDGSIPAIIPAENWVHIGCSGPAWDSVLTYLPYYTYIYRGETNMITESADAFVRYLKYLETKKDKNGLICFGLGDWNHVGRVARDTKSPLIVTCSIYSMDIAYKDTFMLKAIGLEEQSKYAYEQYIAYRKAIRDNLIDFNTMTVLGECQTSQAMGLYYGLFEPEEEKLAFEKLLNFIHEADDHMDHGVLGSRVIFHVLSKFGYTDLAYKMITRLDYPSYGNWIARGATTLWENFDPEFVNSPNHHFWGDISAWFIKTLAGINYNPSGMNLKEVFIKPQFASALENASGFYDTPYGKVSSSWKREKNNIRLSIVIPKEITATVWLPNGYYFEDDSRSKIFTNGEYNITAFKK